MTLTRVFDFRTIFLPIRSLQIVSVSRAFFVIHIEVITSKSLIPKFTFRLRWTRFFVIFNERMIIIRCSFLLIEAKNNTSCRCSFVGKKFDNLDAQKYDLFTLIRRTLNMCCRLLTGSFSYNHCHMSEPQQRQVCNTIFGEILRIKFTSRIPRWFFLQNNKTRLEYALTSKQTWIRL